HKVFKRAIVTFPLPIGKEHNFKGVVDVVHMKAYEFDEHGKAKEIEIPAEGRDAVDKTRERIIELVAESDDALLEKYFDQGTLDDSDVMPNIAKAIAASSLCPVYALSTTPLVGLSTLLDHIIEFAPDPAHHEAEHGKNEKGDPESRKYSASEPFSSSCFRNIPHTFAGRINVFKIFSGKVGTDATVYSSTRSTTERLGALHTMQGKQLDKIPEASAGDIIACVKLKETQTGDTLCDKAHPIIYDPVAYPEAAIAFAIEPKSRQ